MNPFDAELEPDRVPGVRVAAIVVVALLATIPAGVVVWLLASRQLDGGGRTDTMTPATEPPADPFSTASRHERERAEQRRRRDAWEWIDAAHTRVRAPIDVAIDRYLAEEAR